MKKCCLIYVTLVFLACSTCKVVKQSSIQEIQFGFGGGFTGAISTYTLHKNGTLSAKDMKDIKLSCDSLSAIFEMAEQLPKQNFIRPDNTYSFVRILYQNDTYYYAWSWGDLPNQKVIKLYLKLNNQL